MTGTSNPEIVSTRQQRIAELAKQAPQRGFTSLNHHIDLRWLHEAYLRTRRDGAPGVDGQTAADYDANLPGNLQSLLDRAKSGTYHAPPVRRAYIPKGPGTTETRPLGTPTFEDKVLQRAVVMALEPIYEQDFLDCSYGFRPGRPAHQALEALWQNTMPMGGGWIVAVDIRKFFDTLDRACLRDLLESVPEARYSPGIRAISGRNPGFWNSLLARRVRDGVLLRLIGKWLNAGVLEDGELSYPDKGTPQGGVISPLLANGYLHYVLDEWFVQVVKPRLRGRAFLIRYAGDFVLGFACEEDARRVLEVLPLRFGKYGLAIHPDKTRLVPFRAPPSSDRDSSGPQPRPGTFDFLGFTHYWGKSRKGNAVVVRQTSASRFNRAVKAIAEWCQRNRHRPLPAQHKTLSQKLRGHYGYYGITGNSRALANLRHVVAAIWRKWLSRRSWAGWLSWLRFEGVRKQFALPPPIVVHSVYRPAAKR